jgi:hypothetical protein
VVVVVVLAVTSLGGACGSSQLQRIAIPAYFPPGEAWDRMAQAAPTVDVVVMNPQNGPGSARQDAYARQVARSHEAGLRVLGYVPTGYGERGAGEVRAEIENYYAWYGVDGIFFDEASTDCARSGYYGGLTDHVKARDDEALTVLNPGTRTGECYMAVADVLVTFEDTYETYVSGYSAPDWVPDYPPDRFWHLVHSAPDTEAMRRAVDLGRERNAGYLYVTPDLPPNPWDTLPPEGYWRAEASTVGEG